MYDLSQRDSQHLSGLRTASQFRSQSLPRLLRNAAALDASEDRASAAESRERFQRTAHTVGDCLQAVKGLSQQANSARSFREKCSNLLGAAIAASLALQEALSSYKGTSGDLNIQAIATDVQKQLLSADVLVRKYGHERLWDSFVRFESKDDVEKKFDSIIQALQALTNRTWDFIDPQNRIKRDVMEQGAVSSFITTGEAFSRHSLRPASKHKVQGLVAFPDEEGEGPDGVVAWAAHGNIKCLQLSSQITTELRDAGRFLSCMAYDKAGYIWSGHADGSVRLWSVQAATAAGSPAMLSDAVITAIAVDPDTGYCWAGTEDGEVFVVRFKGTESGVVGKLEVARQLLGYDAHSPTARSQDSGGSCASSTQPIAASTPASSNWGGRSSTGSSRHRPLHPHHRRHKQKQHLARTAAGRDLLESCLPSQSPGSGRVKDTCVHSGPVNAILINAGRAYTAGGSGSGSALLVWDSSRFELLRTISKRSTRWCRSAVTCLTMVHWATAVKQRTASGSLGSAPSLGTIGSSGSVGSTAGSFPSGTRAPCSEKHLVTGHADGSVLMWDPSGDTLKPVLLVGPEKGAARKAVRSVAILEELGLLASGHVNGKVYMRKLDPKCRKEPRADDVNISRWNPTTFSLQVHRLGLQHMVAGGHMLVTSGKTGSVKLWPETMLRCLAHEAGIQLPHSHNPVSEAVNVLLTRAGLTSYASTNISQLLTQQQSAQQALQQQQQQTNGRVSPQLGHQRHRSEGQALVVDRRAEQQQQQQRASDAVEAAAAIAASEDHRPKLDEQQGQQVVQQQQEQESSSDARQLQRNNSNTGWSRDMRAASWMLEFDSLGLDPNKRRVIGCGSYGRVEIGSFNQTDVAVKILTDLPNQPNGMVDGPSWDEARLRALRQEVGILATLRHPNVVLFMGVCLSPAAIVTEYCPLGSLYDVLKKARTDRAMACRLTWTRRLLMALDAARGMLYLHSHKPIILHRDLKSPNLFVNNALHVKVGDFNLSRYVTLGSSFVKSSLEINPRWNAPEVIGEGYYSPAADVYAFGIVLWELLTWQEPWEEEGLGSFQIMIAVQQQQQRPSIPALEQLPGQLGPAEAVQGYVGLMQECWAQSYTQRPGFEVIVTRLKAILKMGGPNAAPGPAAPTPAAVAAAPSPFHRNASEPALLAMGNAAAADAAPANPVGQGLTPGHKHTKSEGLGLEAAGMQGPDIADLLHLGNDDDLPGPSAPAPPAAALPPIPATTPEGYGSTDASSHSSSSGSTAAAGASSSNSGSAAAAGVTAGSPTAATGARGYFRQISLAGGVAEVPAGSSSSNGAAAAVTAGAALPSANGGTGVAVGNGVTAATAAKPPRPPRSPVAPGGSPFAAAGGAAAGSPFSPFAAAAQQQQQDSSHDGSAPGTPVTPKQQQQQQQQMPVSYGATSAGLGPGRPAGAKSASPFAAAAAQGAESPTAAAAAVKAINIPVAVPASLGLAVEQGGSSPFSRSPIKMSPFAAAAAAAVASPFAVHGGSSSPLASAGESGNHSGGYNAVLASFSGGSGPAYCPLEAAVEAGSAVDAGTRAVRNSSSSTTVAAGSSSGPTSARPSTSTSNAAEVLQAGSANSSSTPAVVAVSDVAVTNPAGNSSSNNSRSMSGAASLAGGLAAVPAQPAVPQGSAVVASLNAWSGPSAAPQQQQQQHVNLAARASAPPATGQTSAAADLISLDSECLDAAATVPVPLAAPVKLSPQNPFAGGLAASNGL